MPMYRDILTMQMRIKQVQQSLSVCAIEQKACKDLGERINDLQHDFTRNPYDFIMYRQIEKVVERLSSHDLQLLSLKKSSEIDKHWYTSTYVEMHIAGSLSQIYDFFAHISEHQLRVECNNILLDHQKDNQYVAYATLKFFAMKNKALQL